MMSEVMAGSLRLMNSMNCGWRRRTCVKVHAHQRVVGNGVGTSLVRVGIKASSLARSLLARVPTEALLLAPAAFAPMESTL